MRAKMLCAEKWFDQIIEYPDEAIENPAKTQAYRLKVDTYKWVLARMEPSKYGDKTTVEHRGNKENPVMVSIADIMNENSS